MSEIDLIRARYGDFAGLYDPSQAVAHVRILLGEVDRLRAELRLASQELKIHRAEMVVEKARAVRDVLQRLSNDEDEETDWTDEPLLTPIRNFIAAVDVLPDGTWKPAEPWQTPGGLTPEDDPPQPIGDPPEDDEVSQLEWYQCRVKVLEALLVCYRVGQQPSEKLHVELERTGRHINHDGSWRSVVDAGRVPEAGGQRDG